MYEFTRSNWDLTISAIYYLANLCMVKLRQVVSVSFQVNFVSQEKFTGLIFLCVRESVVVVCPCMYHSTVLITIRARFDFYSFVHLKIICLQISHGRNSLQLNWNIMFVFFLSMNLYVICAIQVQLVALFVWWFCFPFL